MNGKKAEFGILNVLCDIECPHPQRQRLNRWLFVIVICILITLVTLLLSQLGVEEENMTIVMMVGVLLSTIVTGGYLYGIVTSVLITLSFNFFFTYSVFGFAIHDQQDMIMLIFFLLATLICKKYITKTET